MPRPSETAKTLKAMRKRAGVRIADVAQRLDLTLSGYQHYEDRYKDKYLPPRFAQVLIDLFEPAGIAREEILALFEPLTVPSPILPEFNVKPPAQPAGRREAHERIELRPGAFGVRDLPVYGSARGGPDGRFEWNGQVVDWAFRPPALEGVEGAYGVYVAGVSMEPRYFDGELVCVHPGRRVTPGCFVVVQLHPAAPGGEPEALVKQFVKQTPQWVILREFNPERRELQFPVERVRQMHRIIMGGENI